MSDDVEARSRADEALVSSIVHQGSVYPATAAAVPFLVEVAMLDTLPADARTSAVVMLGFIAEGNVHLKREYPDEAKEHWGQELDRNLHAAGPSVLEVAGKGDEPALRAWAVWFIRTLPASASDVDRLKALLTSERDAVVRATLALGLPGNDSIQRGLTATTEDPLVRLSAVARLIPYVDDLDALIDIGAAAAPQCGRFNELPDKITDTGPIRLIAQRLGEVSLEREIEWIVGWFDDVGLSEDALYAAFRASERSRRAARMLLEPVRAALERPASPERAGTAAFALSELGLAGVEALRATGMFQQYLHSAEVHLMSAEADFRRLPTGPLRSPDALAGVLAGQAYVDASNLEVVNALNELAAHGKSARSAVPALIAAANRARWPLSRARIEWTLAQVTGDTDRLVSALERDLDGPRPTPFGIRILGELGPKAAGALPSLKAFVDSDRRPGDISTSEDDILVAMAREAIASIEGA